MLEHPQSALQEAEAEVELEEGKWLTPTYERVGQDIMKLSMRGMARL